MEINMSDVHDAETAAKLRAEKAAQELTFIAKPVKTADKNQDAIDNG